MALHFVDPATGDWKTIANPTRAEIAAALASVRRPCNECDADVEFLPGIPHPRVVVTHEDDCPAA